MTTDLPIETQTRVWIGEDDSVSSLTRRTNYVLGVIQAGEGAVESVSYAMASWSPDEDRPELLASYSGVCVVYRATEEVQ